VAIRFVFLSCRLVYFPRCIGQVRVSEFQDLLKLNELVLCKSRPLSDIIVGNEFVVSLIA
jgi:hypothetical protein